MTAPAAPRTGSAEQCALLIGVTTALATDAERFDLSPIGVGVDASWGHISAHVQMPNGATAAVDALAGAYGLAPAAPHGGLYSRKGRVVVDGQDAHVVVFCARPAVPPALPVAAERADTPLALT